MKIPQENIFRMLNHGEKQISPIGLGCEQFTSSPAPETDPERLAYQDVVLEAYKLGVNLFDIADFYGSEFGDCERFMAKVFARIAQYDPDFREKCFITTKGGVLGISPVGEVLINNSPSYLSQACDASLQRLGVEYVDLYYLHRWDGKTSVTDVVDALVSLVKAGKAKHIGLSEVDPKFLAQAHQYALSTYGIPIAAIQPEYSLASREIELSGVFEVAQQLDIAIIPYGSVSRGLLTAKYDEDFQAEGFLTMLPRFQEEIKAQQLESLKTFAQTAEELACTRAQLSLAWLLHQGPRVMPIPATTSIEHLRANVAAVKVELTKTQLQQLDLAYPVGKFAARYPDIFNEVHCDAQWINRYNHVKEKTNHRKLQMEDVRQIPKKMMMSVGFDTVDQAQLDQLVQEKVNHKLAAAMSNRSLDDYSDGILSATVAVSLPDQPLLQASAGQQDISDEPAPVNNDTQYGVASFSKFILMNMVMRLVQQQQLNLHDTVAKWLPQMADQIAGSDQITIEQLLSHHSGLRDKHFKTYKKSQPLSCLLREKLASVPGETYYYCNANYVIIGHLIEAVTQDSLSNQFEQLVAKPCQLTHTQLMSDETKDHSGVAMGYKFTARCDHYKADEDTYMWAATGFYSTSADMVKLFRHFFSDDLYLSPEIRKRVEQSCKPVTFEVVTKRDTYQWDAVCGYALEQHQAQDGSSFYAVGGWKNGSSVFVAFNPETQVVSAFACSKTQCAEKLNLSKLTQGAFYKSQKRKVVNSDAKDILCLKL